MEPLLFLVHRIPYPPNKGDKIRSYHMLKYLSGNYNIFLGTFIDDSTDWQYQEKVSAFCSEACFRPINPLLKKVTSLSGLISGEALTLPYYRDAKMQQWVDNVIHRHNIDKIVVFSSSMAQFVNRSDYRNKVRVIDFVDVDSDKWLQYSKSKNWPESFIYKREARRLQQFEKQVARDFNVSLFVSQDEAGHFSDFFSSQTGNNPPRIDYFYNGVDTQYFDPSIEHDNPYSLNDRVLVFTGAMDYWANVDAVTWFVGEVFPRLSSKTGVKFYIVGSNPSPDVKKLHRPDEVIVTGRVADIRPYLAHAELVVAPLRIARGIQNKVLEAMSMECCVVTSPSAAQGINAEPGDTLYVAETAQSFAGQINALLENPSGTIETGKKARKFVLDNFGWHQNLEKLGSFLQESRV